MDSLLDQLLARRRFLELAGTGIGSAALATLFGQDLLAQAPRTAPREHSGKGCRKAHRDIYDR